MAEDILFSQLREVGIFPSFLNGGSACSNNKNAKKIVSDNGNGIPSTINDIHPSFGFSIRSLLDTMCKRRYISREKANNNNATNGNNNSNGPIYVYELAEGADSDIGEDKIRDFIAGVMSG